MILNNTVNFNNLKNSDTLTADFCLIISNWPYFKSIINIPVIYLINYNVITVFYENDSLMCHTQ